MKKKLIISVFITFIYAVITLIAVLHHEVWADEVQVWQLCKYLSLGELFKQLHNEGHPALFYLLVYPFAKLTANIMYMQILCWLSMCCAVFVLLYKSPFNAFAKFSIITSAGFFYFLPVMARNYAIIPVLLFLAAILYSKQKEHPVFYAVIIALLANTHAFMFGFAFVLSVFFIYDNVYIPVKQKLEMNLKKYITSSAIMLFGIFTVICQLYNSSSSNQFLQFKTEHIFNSITGVIIKFFIKSYNTHILTVNLNCTILACIIAIIFLICFVKLFQNDKRMFLLAFLGIGFQFLIYFFIYDMVYVTRIFLTYIIFIFCFWVIFDKQEQNTSRKSINIFLGLLFILTANNGLEAYSLDINEKYSCSKDISSYIVENLDKKDVVLSAVETTMIPVVYYLDKNDYTLMSAVRKIPLKYVVWDDKSVIIMDIGSWEAAAKYYSELYPDSDIYILRNISMFYDCSLNDKFETVYVATKCIDAFEKYILFKYKK